MPPDEDEDAWDPEAVVEVPITDELDLHTFAPRDVKDVVEEYLHAAQEKGFTRVRLIHGKGVGVLRRIVHGVCEKHPAVASFRSGEERGGGWGATVAFLKPRE
jgi:dsDNA-specific endonuclease/ATPase MutS2